MSWMTKELGLDFQQKQNISCLQHPSWLWSQPSLPFDGYHTLFSWE
jgi:hypothetical protein